MDLKLKDSSQLTLPIGHMPVEYIESSGYPNIGLGTNWGFNPLTFKIDIELEVISNTTANSTIYTCSYLNGPFLYLKCRDANDTTIFIACGSKQNTTVADTVIEFSGKVHIIHQRGSIKVNDTTYTLSTHNRGVSANAYLLPSGAPIVRIYSIKVSSTTTTYYDCIPAISYQEGHFGEACLFNKINNSYIYSNSTGSFTANPSQTLYSILTSAYVKDCPNVSGINILRSCINLNRVRLDIGTQSETVAELYKYAAYAGFNDAYENQTKPRLVGTWTISDYWCNNELDTLENTFDGLTIVTDNTLNIDSMLENDELMVQTLDSTKPNYNPAVAIILNAAGWVHTLQEPAIEGGGLFARPKNLATSSTTTFRGKTTVVDTNGIVSDDTTAEYDFENFEEFQYFDNTSIAAGTSTSVLGAFGGCTKLKKIILPQTVTSIGAYAFYNCTSLEQIVIPTSVTSIDAHAFYNCTSITNIDARNATVSNQGFNGCGNGQGTLKIGKIRGTTNNNNIPKFKHILMYTGSTAETNHACIYGSSVYTIRINGDSNTTSNHNGNNICASSTTNVRFVELMGSHTGTSYGYTFSSSTGLYNGCIMHLGNTVIAGTPTKASASQSRLVKIYVGDGSSKAADEAVFALYNTDTDWSAYCGSGVPGDGKVDLWWNYNGEYKWYYVFDNLTDCTNTNPDAWPHITRGEAYETTIVPDEEYEITSCTVEMMDTDTTSPTYDTYVPQPVMYDSETGIYTIRINSVTGNVKITAAATAIS